MVVIGDTLYVAGGCNGTQMLNSTEIIDLESGHVRTGPPMTSPRANVRLVAVPPANSASAPPKIFAVGGFNGKNFLNTIECLDLETNEWTTYWDGGRTEVSLGQSECCTVKIGQLSIVEEGEVTPRVGEDLGGPNLSSPESQQC